MLTKLNFSLNAKGVVLHWESINLSKERKQVFHTISDKKILKQRKQKAVETEPWNWDVLFEKDTDRETFLKKFLAYCKTKVSDQTPNNGRRTVVLRGGQSLTYYDFNGLNIYSAKIIERLLNTQTTIIEKDISRYLLLLYRDAQIVNKILAENYDKIYYDRTPLKRGRKPKKQLDKAIQEN
jgi:hypothetical protein